MASFDKILQKGKQAVNKVNPQDYCGAYISTILQSLMKLNALYGGQSDVHYIHSINLISCKKCKAALYTITTTDINNPGQTVKWYSTEWEPIEDGTYYLCEKCKQP